MFEKKPRIINLETIENICQVKIQEKKNPIIMSPRKSINTKKNDKIVPKKTRVKKVKIEPKDSGDDILWI